MSKIQRMRIIECDYRYSGTDEIWEYDICCEDFKKAYKNEDIVAERYSNRIILRAYDIHLQEYNEYELKYCPFCGRKIKISKN